MNAFLTNLTSSLFGNATNLVSGVTSFVEYGFDVILALIALTIGAAVAVAMLPPTNPFHALCFSLAKKAAVTAGLGIITPPIEMLPGADIIFDFATPIGLILMWMQFYHQLRKSDFASFPLKSKDVKKNFSAAPFTSTRHQDFPVVDAEEADENVHFHDLQRRR